MGRQVVGDLAQQRRRIGQLFDELERTPRATNLLRKPGVVAGAALEATGQFDARLGEMAGRTVEASLSRSCERDRPSCGLHGNRDPGLEIWQEVIAGSFAGRARKNP